MHKPSKFGDDLTDVRYSFKYANGTQKDIEGFEQGKINHGFRYVFPFYDEQGNHLGAVDIALSPYALKEKLLDVNKIHSYLIVKKDVFSVKKWDSNWANKKYQPSIEHADYLFAKTKNFQMEKKNKVEKDIIKFLRDKIALSVSKDEAFAHYTIFENTVKVISFLPIKNIKDKKTVAYIVSYTDDDNIYNLLKKFKIINTFVFFVLMLLFYFIYKNLNNEKNLNDKNRELKSLVSSYDKNVLYSSTDLEGIITNVSDAFCRVSGYTREELIGQNHNIVRHPGTPSSVFKGLLEKLPEQEPFESEVKNLKKRWWFLLGKIFFCSKV